MNLNFATEVAEKVKLGGESLVEACRRVLIIEEREKDLCGEAIAHTEGVMAKLRVILESEGVPDDEKYAAITIVKFLSASDKHELKRSLVQSGVARPLILLLQSGTEKQKETVVDVIWKLCISDETMTLLVQAGVIPPSSNCSNLA